ncbi:MAG: DUF882 domain-containing protein [Devosiaceae bacterium]|nr:DUF882 domain-containing protein [Devosiaceae bacterium MH13]
MPLQVATAQAQTRTLSLYNTHTHERLTVTYKRNGRFVQAGLDQLNRFLRDWRRDEVTRMDPDLFDIVWEVYREVGASEPIHVVSAYRSPATNNMLRRRSSGVAQNSQHTMGRAMDFFIPGVSASALRAAGLRQQQGGVGYYPRSNTPFVHLDTGSIRMWPRMTRSQLARVFPDGRTVHIPSDGRPMAGFELAQRDLQRGARPQRSTSTTAVASVTSSSPEDRSAPVLPDSGEGGLFGALFGGGDQDDAAPAAAPTRAPARQAQPVQTAAAPAAQQAETEEVARAPFSAPAPILPPNAASELTSAPSAIASVSVPSPVPAPTLDELQIAALSTPATQTPAQDPAPGAITAAPGGLAATFAAARGAQTELPASALPPINRAQQIDQSVPAPGQIAALIEARFAEQRAQEASLRSRIDQTLTAEAPAQAAETAAPVELASAEPRFVPPAPTPVALTPPAAAPITLASAPQAPTQTAPSLATAFTPETPSLSAGQTAINTLAAPAPQQSVVAPVFPPANVPQTAARGVSDIVTGSTPRAPSSRLHPINGDLTASLAKQSIRGSDHAQLIAPTNAVNLSPTLDRHSGFESQRQFSTGSDGFFRRSLTSTYSGQ